MGIPIEETFFKFDEIRDRVIGAGILPVAIDSKNEAHFVLGKERYINHWRGSLKWSGFEGGRKSGENIEHTAAREFIEESLGSIPLKRNVEPTIENVVSMLQNEEYVARIVLCIVHGEDVDRRYHVTYLVEVEHDFSYIERFSFRRRVFVDLQSKSQHLSRLFDAIVSTKLPCEGATFDGTIIVAITRVERIDPHLLRVEFIDDNGDSHVHEIEDIDDDEGNAYIRWFCTRQTCSVDINHIDYCKEALIVERDAKNMVMSSKVNEDYIEKQSIQWWSYVDLQAVISNGGYMHNEFFRAYFLPVLQRALDEIPR